MKVFHQTQDESIIINGEITVTVLRIKGDEVFLGIDAPEWIAIEEKPKIHLALAKNAASLPAR